MELHVDCVKTQVKEEPVEEQCCDSVKAEVEEEGCSTFMSSSPQQTLMMDGSSECCEDVKTEVEQDDVCVKEEPLETQDDLCHNTTTFYPELNSLPGSTTTKKAHNKFICQSVATVVGPAPPSPPKENIMYVAVDRAMAIGLPPALDQMDTDKPAKAPTCTAIPAIKDSLPSTQEANSPAGVSTSNSVSVGLATKNVNMLDTSGRDLYVVSPVPKPQASASLQRGESQIRRKRPRSPVSNTPRGSKRLQADTLMLESLQKLLKAMSHTEESMIKFEGVLEKAEGVMGRLQDTVAGLQATEVGLQAAVERLQGTVDRLQVAADALLKKTVHVDRYHCQG